MRGSTLRFLVIVERTKGLLGSSLYFLLNVLFLGIPRYRERRAQELMRLYAEEWESRMDFILFGPETWARMQSIKAKTKGEANAKR